jgi:hypothetical protein
MGKQSFSKARLKGEKLFTCSGTFRALVLSGRQGGLDRKVGLVGTVLFGIYMLHESPIIVQTPHFFVKIKSNASQLS